VGHTYLLATGRWEVGHTSYLVDLDKSRFHGLKKERKTKRRMIYKSDLFSGEKKAVTSKVEETRYKFVDVILK